LCTGKRYENENENANVERAIKNRQVVRSQFSLLNEPNSNVNEKTEKETSERPSGPVSVKAVRGSIKNIHLYRLGSGLGLVLVLVLRFCAYSYGGVYS